MTVVLHTDEFMLTESDTGSKTLLVEQIPTKIDLSSIGKFEVRSVKLSSRYQGNLDWLLDTFPDIKELSLFGNSIDTSHINSFVNLESLFIKEDLKVELDFQCLEKLSFFEVIWNEYIAQSFNIPSNVNLLSIAYYSEKDLEKLSNQSQLRRLNISQANKLVSLNGLNNLNKLEFLQVFSAKNLSDISALNHVDKLDCVNLHKCNKIKKIPSLKGVQIREFLIETKELESLEPLNSWEKLEILTFVCSLVDNNVAILKEFDNLQFALFNNKKTFNAKVKDISLFFENKGFNQSKIRSSRTVF